MQIPTSPLTGKRAVIIDDEGIIVMHLTRVLHKAGSRVVGNAQTARAGIDLVLRERPDYVLMDITMPGELNGLDAAEAILAQYPVCIVIVSAYMDDTHRERAARINTCGYIFKPIVAQDLIPELEKALANWEHPRPDNQATINYPDP